MNTPARPILAAVTVPWNAFVAVFLYYTLLAVLALSGISPALPVVATAYAAPLVAYAVVVAARLAGHAVRAPAMPQSLTNAAR